MTVIIIKIIKNLTLKETDINKNGRQWLAIFFFFPSFCWQPQSPDAKHWKIFTPTVASGTLADSISNFILQF